MFQCTTCTPSGPGLVADEGPPNDTEVKEDKEGHGQEDVLGSFAISLQALSGLTHQSTMKMKGTIQHKLVMILIDSGSTHSFIDSKFSQRMALPKGEGQSFEVLVANGDKLLSQGMSKGVSIDCQGKKNLSRPSSLTNYWVPGCARGQLVKHFGRHHLELQEFKLFNYAIY